jgi:papain like protease
MSIVIVKDLRAQFGPVRDQDPHPTCMAFAGGDAHAGARTGWEPLSVEWAYYHALQREGQQPHKGVHLSTMLETLRGDGQPIETAWPYIASLFTDFSTYAPPSCGDSIYRRDSAPNLATVEGIVGQIDQDKPVLFTMSISRSFFSAASDGVVSVIEPLEQKRVHAFVAVGHGRRNSDRFILVRNSWGEAWAMAGHAWLNFEYLKPRLLVAATMTGEL